MRHQFKISGSSRTRLLSDATLLGTYAILRLPASELAGTNPRTCAAKFLRQTGGMDVEDAYAITDYLKEHASLHSNGDVKIAPPEQKVQYTGLEG